MVRFILTIIACMSFALPATAEIVRGSMDCKITHQLYQQLDKNGLQSANIMPRGDKIGAKLRLRYEFDRATPALPWRLKTEFGRSAVYFDAKFPPASLSLRTGDDRKAGFTAHSSSKDVTALFLSAKIQLATKDSTAIFIHNEDDKWTGLYTESRSKSGADHSHFGLMMGFDCVHTTNVIEKLTSLLK